MALTAKDVQGHFYNLLRQSPLAAGISGGVYRAGFRPRDSRLEDAVVIFTAGLPDQIESGSVTINVYVADIDPDHDGTWVENGARTAAIERMAADWAGSLTAAGSGFKTSLMQAVHTQEEPQTRQHFVVVRLAYEYFDQ